MVGTLISTGYQIVSLQGQLTSMQLAAVQLEPKLKAAQFQKEKLYKLAADVLALAPTDPAAKQITTQFGIEQRGPAPGAPPAQASPATDGNLR
jgi:hypothetical protein